MTPAWGASDQFRPGDPAQLGADHSAQPDPGVDSVWANPGAQLGPPGSGHVGRPAWPG